MIGRTVSHYKVLEQLGQGGMGVVYKALDLKLNRTVALKFLPPHLTQDQEAIDRFINEAQAASALDHANICTIHEINETEDGQMFICMAYYGGETLEKTVTRGQLAAGSVIDIAMQVAHGLERAHEAGITHRDIKPSNLIITPRGEVKIIDFGLAKLAGLSKLTKTGSTPGTVAYMSPEQVQGQPMDQRTDIWSLGVVLYEMFTGHLPFHGENEAAVIFSIVNEPPVPGAGISPGLQRVLDKALTKEPEARYQGIDDLLADLQHARQGAAELIKPATPAKLKKLKLARNPAAVVAIASAAIFLLALFIANRQPVRPILATHKQVTFVGNARFPAISPDGQFIAYATGKEDEEQKVLIQDLAGGQHLEVFSGVSHSSIQWSPDGSELMFWAQQQDSSTGIFIVPRLGGSSRCLSRANSKFLCWSSDGARVASANLYSKQILVTNKATGDTSAIKLSGSYVWFRNLDWSPVGDWLLFMTSKQQRNVIWTIKSDGSGQQKVMEDSVLVFSPRWSADGQAIYYLRINGQAKDLMKIKIAPETGKAEGPAYAVQTGLQAGDFFSLSNNNKRLLYLRESRYSNLWRVDLEGKGQAPTVQIRKLSQGTSWFHRPRISPDGASVAFASGKRPQANIYVMPLTGGSMQQLTFMNNVNMNPVWSPDGKEIAFGSTHDGNAKIWRIGSSGGTPRAYDRTISSTAFHLTWSPGPQILYPQLQNRNFHFLDPQTEQEKPLVPNDTVGAMFYPRYSPDGKKMAIYWNRAKPTNLHGLWVISLEDSSQTLLARGKCHTIEWSADGKWIYVWYPEKKPLAILKIPANRGRAQLVVTLPFENIDAVGGLAMTPDGKRLVCASVEAQSDVWLMENFDPRR